MMKAVTKDIEAKTADKEQYAKHIKALLLDRGAQYLDVLPFWDSNNINLRFDEEEDYMSFTPEQKTQRRVTPGARRCHHETAHRFG